MLKNDIGIIAGMIWHLLHEKGELTVGKIGEIIAFKEVFITMAIGWLAKEDKIDFFEKDDTLYIELSYHERYRKK